MLFRLLNYEKLSRPMTSIWESYLDAFFDHRYATVWALGMVSLVTGVLVQPYLPWMAQYKTELSMALIWMDTLGRFPMLGELAFPRLVALLALAMNTMQNLWWSSGTVFHFLPAAVDVRPLVHVVARLLAMYHGTKLAFDILSRVFFISTSRPGKLFCDNFLTIWAPILYFSWYQPSFWVDYPLYKISFLYKVCQENWVTTLLMMRVIHLTLLSPWKHVLDHQCLVYWNRYNSEFVQQMYRKSHRDFYDSPELGIVICCIMRAVLVGAVAYGLYNGIAKVVVQSTVDVVVEEVVGEGGSGGGNFEKEQEVAVVTWTLVALAALSLWFFVWVRWEFFRVVRDIQEYRWRRIANDLHRRLRLCTRNSLQWVRRTFRCEDASEVTLAMQEKFVSTHYAAEVLHSADTPLGMRQRLVYWAQLQAFLEWAYNLITCFLVTNACLARLESHPTLSWGMALVSFGNLFFHIGVRGYVPLLPHAFRFYESSLNATYNNAMLVAWLRLVSRFVIHDCFLSVEFFAVTAVYMMSDLRILDHWRDPWPWKLVGHAILLFYMGWSVLDEHRSISMFGLLRN